MTKTNEHFMSLYNKTDLVASQHKINVCQSHDVQDAVLVHQCSAQLPWCGQSNYGRWPSCKWQAQCKNSTDMSFSQHKISSFRKHRPSFIISPSTVDASCCYGSFM